MAGSSCRINRQQGKGIEIFREIPKRYQVLKALTESVEQRPTVMLNTPWNDSWADAFHTKLHGTIGN